MSEEKFIVSSELLRYWYGPHRKWWGEELFRPTHMIELVESCEILTSDLVHLHEDGNAYTPQEFGKKSLPAYIFENEEWWNYMNETPRWKKAECFVQETLWTENLVDHGFVYFIREGEFGNIKIGWSKNPTERLAGLQTANSKKLEILAAVPGSLQEEKRLHGFFQNHRVQGEWFRNNKDLEDFITNARQNGFTWESSNNSSK